MSLQVVNRQITQKPRLHAARSDPRLRRATPLLIFCLRLLQPTGLVKGIKRIFSISNNDA